MRGGFTLVETTVVLTIMAILVAIVVPPSLDRIDRLLVSNATGSVASFYGRARFGALLHGSRVRIEFRPDSMKAFYEGGVDSLFVSVPGPSRFGVNIVSSRSVIRVHPNGVGLGAANTKLVLWRGAAAESLTTSRLGRIRRWR